MLNPITRIKKLFEVEREQEEIWRWLLSLIPLLAAFGSFVIFTLPLEITQRDVLYVIGLTAGFTGLQSSWIMRGWRRNEGVTVLLGIIGIGLAFVAALIYINYLRT